MSTPILYVDLGTANRQLLQVRKRDGTAEDISDITRVVISGDDLAEALDSGAEGVETGAGKQYDWATDGASGILVLHLGHAAVGLAAGTYKECALTLYDSGSPTGIRCRTRLHLVAS